MIIRILAASFVLSLCSSRGADTVNSAIVPVPQGGMEKRHAEKVEAIKKQKYDLLLIGDSITHNLDLPPYKAVWDQFYAPRNAIGLGYSGGRTENILWNLEHGELEGQSPKVAVLLIGTNNSDDANYRVVSTAEQIAEGTAAIVKLLREKSPETKILLLRIFPRRNVYRKPDGTERGDAARRFAINLRAGELVAKLADGEHIFFLDVNHVFQRLDGGIDPALMPDLLHPSPAGALAWARAMEPALCELLGDTSHDTPPANTAIIPASKLENDFYDWWERHKAALRAKDEARPDIVLIGDSITHLWGGNPPTPGRKPNGAQSFEKAFTGKQVLNLGFGWDRTQNVLWRLDHGEFDGLHPALVVVNIGTNNFAQTKNARANTPEEIAEGVRAILIRVRAKSPESHIVLMGLFPRGEKPGDPIRVRVAAVNALLAEFGKTEGITFLDIGTKLTQPDGTISREMMGDFLHPAEAGYEVWGEALKSAIR
jgi:lysophospholipase L1-like esterase